MNNHLPTRKENILANKAFVGAIFFALFLTFYEEIRFSMSHVFFVWTLPTNDLWLRLVGYLAVVSSFFLTLIYAWISFVSRFWYRCFYFILFSLAIVIQYNYRNIFGRFMSLEDLSTAFASSPALWTEAAALFFSWDGLIPIAVYLSLLWWSRNQQKYGFSLLLSICVMTLGVNSILYHTAFNRTPAVSSTLLFRTLVNAYWEQATIASFEREEILPVAAEVSRPLNNVILVVDESVRSDHLSINGYERPTTPYLESLTAQGFVANWGTAVSAGTCSIISNGVILTGVGTLPDTEYRMAQNPTIFQYAKAMGYETYYFDSQADYLWIGLTVSDLPFVDHHITRSNLGGDREADLRAADQIQKIIGRSTGNFIWINKEGVHFHYNDVYPPEATVWQPIPPARTYENYEQVRNSYDNGILYNVDGFFQALISDSGILENTTIVYTSDHGQTLQEHEETWPHCGDTKNEASVPLVLLNNTGHIFDTAYKASHYNIFATLLDLMAVPESIRLHDYPLSLFTATVADSQDRYFLGGTSEAVNSVLINFDELE
jgi:glucan phosphoethanolaminetransferase (alkaline phosphatase superfamily)